MEKKLRIEGIASKLAATVGIALFAAALVILKIPCPILGATGIPCLGCGMTRALLSALRLDLAAAFRYHPMFWAVPIIYLEFLFDGRLFKNKRVNRVLLSAIVIGFIANWIVKIVL